MKLTDKLKTGVLAGLVTILVASGCASTPRIPGPNKAVLAINSEPVGARIYEGGELIGTTPYVGSYILKDRHYNSGILSTNEFTIAKEGYLPKTKKLRLGINPNDKKLNDKKFYYSKLFLLEGDPRYIYNINNSKTEITNKDSGIGELNKGADLLQKYLYLKQMKNR